MNRTMQWMACVVAGILVTGCSARKEEPKPAVSVENEPADATVGMFEEMNLALEGGDTNGAIAKLQAAFADEAFASEKPWIFRNVLDLLLSAGRLDEAREMMLAALRENAPYAQNGFGMIYRYYVEKGEAADRLEWTGRLMDTGLAGRMKLYAFGWHLVAVHEVEGMDGALALVATCVKDFPEDEARQVLGGFVEKVLSGGDADGAAKFLDKLDEVAGDASPGIRSLAIAARARLLLAGEKWEEADQQLRAAAGGMLDEDLARALRQFADQAGKKGETARTEKLDEFVIDQVADKPLARDIAVAGWLEAARKAGNAGAIMDRLSRVVEMGLSFESTARHYRAAFYEVLNSKDAAAIARLMDIGDSLMGRVGPLGEDQGIRMLQLDAMFLTEDYDRAIKLVEAGITGRDEAWREMALNKIKAHKALKEGRPEEAVERFRVFMAGVEKWENAEQDPATGVMHTREMTLGRNAMRIGEIYAGMGKEEEATKAYEEAADYYTRAMMSVKPDSKEYEILKSEMDRLPLGK